MKGFPWIPLPLSPISQHAPSQAGLAFTTSCMQSGGTPPEVKGESRLQASRSLREPEPGTVAWLRLLLWLQELSAGGRPAGQERVTALGSSLLLHTGSEQENVEEGACFAWVHRPFRTDAGQSAVLGLGAGNTCRNTACGAWFFTAHTAVRMGLGSNSRDCLKICLSCCFCSFVDLIPFVCFPSGFSSALTAHLWVLGYECEQPCVPQISPGLWVAVLPVSEISLHPQHKCSCISTTLFSTSYLKN